MSPLTLCPLGALTFPRRILRRPRYHTTTPPPRPLGEVMPREKEDPPFAFFVFAIRGPVLYADAAPSPVDFAVASWPPGGPPISVWEGLRCRGRSLGSHRQQKEHSWGWWDPVVRRRPPSTADGNRRSRTVPPWLVRRHSLGGVLPNILFSALMTRIALCRLVFDGGGFIWPPALCPCLLVVTPPRRCPVRPLWLRVFVTPPVVLLSM